VPDESHLVVRTIDEKFVYPDKKELKRIQRHGFCHAGIPVDDIAVRTARVAGLGWSEDYGCHFAVPARKFTDLFDI
jgi:hypothetical protein